MPYPSASPADASLTLRLRPLIRTTALGRPGQPPVIIHPAGDPAWTALAARLVHALAARGVNATCTTDTALMPERRMPLPDAWRRRPLIVLGSLGTNRVLQPHYANYLCATDADYPGPTGWELRTLVDPYATGTNLILCGGSRPESVARAVELLGAEINRAPEGIDVPWLMQVELDPAVAAAFAAWPHAPLDRSLLQLPASRGYYFFADLIRAVSTYTHMWWLTGDARHAEFAVFNFRALNDHVQDSYGDWHYLAERFLRALPLLAGGGLLTPADLDRTYGLLLNTALASQNDWWRMREGRPPFGHRHQGKGTYEFLTLARCLRDTTEPSPALRALCDRWIAECQAFLDALGRAGIDDQDDESTFNNLAQIYRYALGEERHEFFTGGHARLGATRALALHDSLGSGAGQGGYGEGLSMYYQQEAATQVACSAFYHGDGGLKWILHHLPRLARAQRFMPFQFTPTFVHQFATGDELTALPPHTLSGITLIPASPHLLEICTRPPLNYEPRGHLANALETWMLPEAVGLTRLTQSEAFDKLVLRGGFASTDAYLLLQGYQGGFRWQGHMQAANCIVRFAQAGHVWLVQNTLRHSPYDKNGLLIGDGSAPRPQPPLARLVTTADFASAALTVTQLTDCAQADWTRHVFWHRPGAGWFVVIDRVEFKSAGTHTLTCTWRTPAWAALDGRRWHSAQGRHRFELVAGDHGAATCEEENNQGASRPYVLRQRRIVRHQAGGTSAFANLFYVRPQEDTSSLDLQRLGENSAVVMQDGHAIAWCGAALTAGTPWLPAAFVAADSALLGDDRLVLAGVTILDLPGLAFRSGAPGSLMLDFAAHRLVWHSGSSVPATASFDGRQQTLAPGESLALPAALCAKTTATFKAWLGSLQPVLAAPATSVPTGHSGWRPLWQQPVGPLVAERLRNLCITANPPPIDGQPLQLIDTILPQSRELVELWPAAAHYDITLRFAEPQAVASVSLMGDNAGEPTLRTYSPLPAGIRLEAETTDGHRQPCLLQPAPDRIYKRVYVDLASALQQQQAAVNLTVRALHLHCPAPAGGLPFVLHEIEVLGARHVQPAVKHWLAADLDGDGEVEIILADTAGQVRVLDGAGRERWAHALALEITHLSVQPVGAGGAPAVCLGLAGGELQAYDAAGRLILQSQLANGLRGFSDRLMGIFYALNSLAVWRRDATNRGWLVAGGYGLLLFLDGEGRILGHSWGDGAWMNNLLVLPEGHPSAGDVYARSGWNHGINCYRAHPGPEPSGVVQTWGGFRQPMFRALAQVVPFVNGPSLHFTLEALPGNAAGGILAAAELGVGLLSLATREWLWVHEYAGRLETAIPARCDGQPAVIVGGADGFVTAYALADGRWLRSHLAHGPVVSVTQSAADGLIVATRTGLEVLDSAWQPRAALVRPLRRALSLGGHRLLLTREDHSLELLGLPS